MDRTLERVPGVIQVAVEDDGETFAVTYDPEVATLEDLTTGATSAVVAKPLRRLLHARR